MTDAQHQLIYVKEVMDRAWTHCNQIWADTEKQRKDSYAAYKVLYDQYKAAKKAAAKETA